MTRNIFIISGVLLVLIVMLFFTFGGSIGGGKYAMINGHKINLELALTEAQQVKGLSGRGSLAKDAGMLFLFDTPSYYSFWMKEMRIPIDIVFLRDKKVVTIYHSVQPFITVNGFKQQNLTNYVPTENSDKVIELPAGSAKDFGLKVGDTIAYKL